MDFLDEFNKTMQDMGLGDVKLTKTITIKYDDYMSLLSLIDGLMEEVKAKDKIIKELKREV